MRALTLLRKTHGESVVDLCEGCHALWFDTHESVQLTPNAIVALFGQISAASAAHRRALPSAMPCPRCKKALAQTQDQRHATRFSYWRCAAGHGRFTPFVQFLREKDFIRPLTPAEIARLAAHVRTIRCSGCGAPVDLARDMVCSFCRAPVEALDPAAVATTLEALGKAEAKRTTVDVDALADAIIASHRRPPQRGVSDLLGGKGDDLVAVGLAMVVAAVCH